MGSPASVSLDQLTDEVVRSLRPGDRMILTSHGRAVAEVIPLTDAAGTRSARALGGSLRAFGPATDAAIDQAIEAAVGELDRDGRGRG